MAYRASVALGNIVSMLNPHVSDNCQSHPDKLYETRNRSTPLDLKSTQVTELRDVMGVIRSGFNDGRISSIVQEIDSLTA